MIWYEWLDETVLGVFLLKLVSELKFLHVFMGREHPVEFDIYLALFFNVFLFVS